MKPVSVRMSAESPELDHESVSPAEKESISVIRTCEQWGHDGRTTVTRYRTFWQIFNWCLYKNDYRVYDSTKSVQIV